MAEYSEEMKAYFDELEEGTMQCMNIAMEARKEGHDPVSKVEIKVARSMAERVVGLISTVAPQLAETNKAVKRIEELEKKYGPGDWRIAMIIAHEIAQEKFCKFSDVVEAMEVGIRMGFSYVTVGVVSSPLEGFTHIEVKKRRDGKEYLALNYSGPIRNAGGTAAAVSVLISDYVRKKMGYAEYDADEKEVKRYYAEVMDYHERVTNLQYVPSRPELEFLCEHLPIEIDGDPTDNIEVSNFKNLDRIKGNHIRGGMCLIMSSCIPLKAKKLWKQLSKWGHDLDMEQWDMLEEFIHIQKEMKAKGGNTAEKKDDGQKIKPDYTYIADLVAGRPVFGHPLREGALRLRFGRSRFSGFSAQSIHPGTMHILNNFIATGTQCKTERPGKAGAYSPCDTIDGPIVRLKDGSVHKIETEKHAIEVKKDVEKILYSGDVLISYGDFFNRAHSLIPPGYCEEWWIQEAEKAVVDLFGNLDMKKLAELCSVDEEILTKIFKYPLKIKPTPSLSFNLSTKLSIPLHPRYTFFWRSISRDQLLNLVDWLSSGKIVGEGKIERLVVVKKDEEKEILELLGVPHRVLNNEFIIIENEWAYVLVKQLSLSKSPTQNVLGIMQEHPKKTVLELLNLFTPTKVKDKSGVFIGSRLGRPEKAKHRKMQGSPHVLFPIGEEGGRLRSFQAALKVGKITSDFPIYINDETGEESVLPTDILTGEKLTRKYVSDSGYITKEEAESIQKENKKIPDDQRRKRKYVSSYKKRDIDIRKYFDQILKKLNTKVYPDLIKGVKGTVSKDHMPEHLMKGILRAKYNLHVNKDGTIRYDCSELPVTHFKPKEIFVSVEKLREIGYTHDIHGKPLERKDQICEIKPQDLIIPCCPDSLEEPADKIVFRTGKFIDELLVNLYGLPPYYNFKTREDIVGTKIIGLAPHTSAGIVGRIIGFSKTQTFLAHPLLHAAMRRDCDGDESCFFLLLDAFMNFSQKYLPTTRGSTMDAPLVLTLQLIPAEVDDMVFDLDINWRYPLEFYEACEQYKMPWDVKINQVNQFLHTERQYEGYGFTHDTSNYNAGVLCSAYKLLPSMQDKLASQMELAEKLRAVDVSDVARLVIEKHFIKDLKGNLRKYSMQQFRCVGCNEKFRRPPLKGTCPYCNGKIIFTISQGSVAKYLEPSLSLARTFHVSPYLYQSIELIKEDFESIFGREKEIQTGLGSWFG